MRQVHADSYIGVSWAQGSLCGSNVRHPYLVLFSQMTFGCSLGIFSRRYANFVIDNSVHSFIVVGVNGSRCFISHLRFNEQGSDAEKLPPSFCTAPLAG